jgi:hypothetical protein
MRRHAVDPIEYLRQRLAEASAEVRTAVEPLLAEARQVYGGDSVYIRSRDPAPPARRTVQRRARQT